MRTRLIASLVALQALAPAAALAQRRPSAPAPAPAAPVESEEESAEESPSGGETEATEVQDLRTHQGDNVRLGPGAKATSGEVHTVVKGDTLWDLSQQYLGSPWYWPKVWSYNPEIANPHWIYPGNRVRFSGNGEDLAARVEAGGGGNEGEAVGEQDDGVGLPEGVTSDAFDSVQVVGKLAFEATGQQRIAQHGFVTTREVQESGTIDSSFEEKELLAAPEPVYIDFKDRSGVKIGDQYLVFRTAGEVTHPVTGRRYGYLTRLVATARVTRLSSKLATATLTKSFDEVRRGDRVGPAGEPVGRVLESRPNAREVKGGLVIGVMDPGVTLYGEHHMVVIDRGSADGVAPGNTFTVIRQSNAGGDFLNPEKWDERYPVEDVGTCRTVEVKDKASTCLLTRSLREIVWGDRVEMRAGDGAGKQAALR